MFSPAARLVQRVFCTVHKISRVLVGTELPVVKARVDSLEWRKQASLTMPALSSTFFLTSASTQR